MKKIIICLAAFAAVMGFVACTVTKPICRDIKIPHNLKPISCEDFNDVSTIYWNLLSDCNEIGVQADYLCDTSHLSIEGWERTLLIEGWGRKSGNFIILCPDSISAAAADVEKASNHVNLYLHWHSERPKVVDYYHIVCREIWHYKVEHSRYRIELQGAIHHYDETQENYIIKKEVEDEN